MLFWCRKTRPLYISGIRPVTWIAIRSNQDVAGNWSLMAFLPQLRMEADL